MFSEVLLQTALLKAILFISDPGRSLGSRGSERGVPQAGSDAVGSRCYISKDGVKAEKPLQKIPAPGHYPHL